MTTHTMPTTGTREEHLAARLELLAQEKELTRRSDELARRRRELPWVPIEKTYTFDTHQGERTLAELFDGRSQLLVYHFMLGPEWTEGCKSCSFWSDGFDGVGIHLAHRDVTFLAISRAPLERIDAYRRRMGWSFPWVSSLPGDFNMDFGVSFPEGATSPEATYNYTREPMDEELPGLSAFALVDGVVHHTYSCYGRGIDALNVGYQLLDRAPRGRDEDGLPSLTAWLRRHDDYEDAA